MRRGLHEAFMPDNPEVERGITTMMALVMFTDLVAGLRSRDQIVRESGLNGLAARELTEVLMALEGNENKTLEVLKLVSAFVIAEAYDRTDSAEFNERLGLR